MGGERIFISTQNPTRLSIHIDIMHLDIFNKILIIVHNHNFTRKIREGFGAWEQCKIYT